MRRAYCEDCRAQRPFRRAFGWGTFFAVLVTAGVWLLALPFYPLRCPQCGRALSGAASRRSRPWSRLDWLILAALVAAILVVVVAALLAR
jgi:hypothetical protein